jgi:hypothetical protein
MHCLPTVCKWKMYNYNVICFIFIDIIYAITFSRLPVSSFMDSFCFANLDFRLPVMTSLKLIRIREGLLHLEVVRDGDLKCNLPFHLSPRCDSIVCSGVYRFGGFIWMYQAEVILWFPWVSEYECEDNNFKLSNIIAFQKRRTPQTTIEIWCYLLCPLSRIETSTGEWCFLCGPCRIYSTRSSCDPIRRTSEQCLGTFQH